VMLLALVLACGPAGDDVDLRDSPVELEIPDLTGVDLNAVYVDALKMAIAADTRVAWGAHVATLGSHEPGCPDFYTGTPDLENDDVDEDATGWSWADHCSTSTGRTYGGFAYWEDALTVEQDAAGLTTRGERLLIAD